jgi:hypothetical protein
MLLMMLLMLDRWIYGVKENIPKMAGINLNAGPSLGVDFGNSDSATGALH